VDAALGIGCWVDAYVAGARRGKAGGTAVAREVALVEYLNEGMLTMALYRASVADTGGIVRVGGVCGRRIAGETCEDALAECTQGFCAVLDALGKKEGLVLSTVVKDWGLGSVGYRT
jgi:hypothetical protein